MTFDSYHWYNSRTATPQLEAARKAVATGDRMAFELLLRSGDPVAVGIAFDQFHYADAATRHGTSSPFEAYSHDVVAQARAVLQAEPSPRCVEAEPGANHASALLALMNLAEPEDAPLIARALEKTHTANLRVAAAYAGSTALEKSSLPDERLIAELDRLAHDDSAGLDERQTALSALGRTPAKSAADALLRALALPEISLQAIGALHLLDRDPGYRDRIVEVARTWPEDAPYPAYEVRDLLTAAAV
jgi:hypothetical protein